MVIVEESNLPHPWCTRCDMLLPWVALNGRHPKTTQRKKGTEWKRRRLEAEEARESTERAFKEYGRPLTSVSSFKYLVHILMALDDDWAEVVGNLWKEREKWAWLSRILEREGENVRVSGNLFKDLIQAVLLFGSEMWVPTPCTGQPMGGFQHRVDLRIMGKKTWRPQDGSWEPPPPPLEEAMREEGMEEVEEYVLRRHNTVAQYIATRPIMDLCEEAVRRPGARVYKRWW